MVTPFSQEQIEALKAEARLHPHMKAINFVAKLERKKNREERERREMVSDVANGKPQPFYSWFENMMGRN